LNGVVGEKLRHIPPVTGALILDSSTVTDRDLAELALCPGLQSIQEINLSRTTISAAGLAHLKQFPRLTLLTWIGKGGAPYGPSAADLAALRGLKLTSITFENCTTVGDDGMEHLATLPLTELQLNGTSVTDIGVRKLRPLTGLTKLRITNPGVTDKSIETIAGFPQLKFLELAHTGVSDSGVARLVEALPNLTYLNLDSTAVGDGTLKALAKYTPKLDLLILSRTKVTADGLKHLAALPVFRYLALEGTKNVVTVVGLNHLTGCKAMTHLSVKGTDATYEMLIAFQRKLPYCLIHWNGVIIEPLSR
jgi:internalin A